MTYKAFQEVKAKGRYCFKRYLVIQPIYIFRVLNDKCLDFRLLNRELRRGYKQNKAIR